MFQAVKGTVRQVVFGGECIPVFVGVLQCLPKRPVVNQTCHFPSVISCIINLIGSLKYLFITNTMRKEGEIMRYRQIFLAVSAMLIAWLMACGCSGGNADGQGAYGEGGGVLTGKDLYKKTGRFW